MIGLRKRHTDEVDESHRDDSDVRLLGQIGAFRRLRLARLEAQVDLATEHRRLCRTRCVTARAVWHDDCRRHATLKADLWAGLKGAPVSRAEVERVNHRIAASATEVAEARHRRAELADGWRKARLALASARADRNAVRRDIAKLDEAIDLLRLSTEAS